MPNMDDNSTKDFVEAQQRKREQIADSYSIEELRAELERRDADMDRIADKLADRMFERLGLDDDSDDDDQVGGRASPRVRAVSGRSPSGSDKPAGQSSAARSTGGEQKRRGFFDQ